MSTISQILPVQSDGPPAVGMDESVKHPFTFLLENDSKISAGGQRHTLTTKSEAPRKSRYFDYSGDFILEHHSGNKQLGGGCKFDC